jgi:hypothetical protein
MFAPKHPCGSATDSRAIKGEEKEDEKVKKKKRRREDKKIFWV